MLRIYLSGSMGGRFAEEVKAERAEATQELAKCGLHAVDPAAAEAKLWGNRKTAKIQLNMKRKIMEAMVWQDLWLIRRCDVLLVLTGDTCSDGTWHEMAFARFAGIPVVLVSPRRHSEELMGWTTVLIPKNHIFADVKRAAQFIRRTYARDYEKHKEYFGAAVKNAASAMVNKAKKKLIKKAKKVAKKTKHAR